MVSRASSRFFSDAPGWFYDLSRCARSWPAPAVADVRRSQTAHPRGRGKGLIGLSRETRRKFYSRRLAPRSAKLMRCGRSPRHRLLNIVRAGDKLQWGKWYSLHYWGNAQFSDNQRLIYAQNSHVGLKAGRRESRRAGKKTGGKEGRREDGCSYSRPYRLNNHDARRMPRGALLTVGRNPIGQGGNLGLDTCCRKGLSILGRFQPD